MENIIVYGIPNCNSVKKAIDWFTSNKINIVFHDYKKSGITKQKLIDWSKQVGWEILLNKKGTTWKGISLEEQLKIKNQKTAIHLMSEKTSIIKRPVIEYKNELLVGFDEEKLKAVFL